MAKVFLGVDSSASVDKELWGCVHDNCDEQWTYTRNRTAFWCNG